MNQAITTQDKKVIYRARRGLKELDFYLDPYVREHYLHASAAEKATFATLVEQEDPDLLDWFMGTSQPQDVKMADLISKIIALHAAK